MKNDQKEACHCKNITYGRIRAAVQQALRKNKFVKQFRLGQYGEGEDGVTIAEFR